MHFDVAVVGLGAMGSATLYQCALRGSKAIGFDLYAPPHANGSSHGDTRITRLGVGEGAAYVPFVKASHRIWRQLERDTGEELLTQCGALIIAANGGKSSHHGTADFVTRTRMAAEEHGIAHEILNADEIGKRFPYLVGLNGDEVGYYEPEGGFVRPEACIRAELTMARRLGAEIRTGTEVEAVGRNGNGVLSIETAAGTYTADRIVLCAGAWTGELTGEAFSGLLTVTRQVLHWFEVEDAALVPESGPVLIWMHGEADTDYFYAFPPQRGEGAMKFATEQYADVTSARTVRREVDPSESASMFERHIEGRVAGIGRRVVKEASCLYTATPDRGFVLDRLPSDPDILAVSACSGHGFKHSAGIGEAVALAPQDAGSEFGRAPFRLGRFR